MCFSVDWFIHLLIVLVVLAGTIAILRIWVFPFLSANLDPRITQTINVIIWVFICVFVIYLVAYLFICLLGSAHLWPSIR